VQRRQEKRSEVLESAVVQCTECILYRRDSRVNNKVRTFI